MEQEIHQNLDQQQQLYLAVVQDQSIRGHIKRLFSAISYPKVQDPSFALYSCEMRLGLLEGFLQDLRTRDVTENVEQMALYEIRNILDIYFDPAKLYFEETDSVGIPTNSGINIGGRLSRAFAILIEINPDLYTSFCEEIRQNIFKFVADSR